MPTYQVVVHNVPGSGTVRLGTVEAPTHLDAKAEALVKFGEEGLRPVATEQQKALAIYDDDDFDVRLCK